MSRMIRIDAARRTQRPQGRSRRYRRAALAVGTPLLLTTVGCTAQPPDQPGAESAPVTADAVPLLEDLPEFGAVPPGTYVISPIDAPASAPQAPVMSIPAGYSNIEGAGVSPGYLVDGAAGAVWLWDIQSVYTHPCDVGGYPEPVGPSVADLAGALATQPMRDGTDPAPVTIGGYDGLYVELSTPADLDFTTCRQGSFHSWPGRFQRDAGQVDLLWIVDVDGQRITFDVSYPPSATPEQVAELKEIVTTATFVRREGA
ncbi:hypothetical protein HP550_08870 [Cellulomonas humilata]|uniref:Uncharacterized protein n=1 Tax=Cellulomonas humilata TaxID=144055 RepID=A0A7Y6A2M2_9CELL|nr:hypothetical protein [Cellulomonas humilata]NUU17359.1 hypothetical protein [Cellulomonas humilata]